MDGLSSVCLPGLFEHLFCMCLEGDDETVLKTQAWLDVGTQSREKKE